MNSFECLNFNLRVLKKLSAVTIVSLMSGSAVYGLIESETTSLSVNAGVNYQTESNVFANSAEMDDSSITSTLGANYERRKGIVYMDAALGLNIGRYDTFSDQDYEDFSGSLGFSFPHQAGNPLDATVGLSYTERSAADDALGRRLNTTTTAASTSFVYNFYELYSVSFGADYSRADYEENNLVETDTWATTFGFLYAYSEKLDLGLNYRHRKTMPDDKIEPESKDNAFFVSAVGQVLPKTEASISLGWQERKIDGGNNDDSLFAEISLLWSASETLSVELTGSSDFATQANNQTSNSKILSLGTSLQVLQNGTLDASVYYEDTTYDGGAARSDDAYGFTIGGGYNIYENISLNASYSYTDRDSSVAVSTYKMNTFIIGVSAEF